MKGMRKYLMLTAGLCFVFAVFGQDNQKLLQAYRKSFSTSGIDAKIRMLADPDVNKPEMAPLFIDALTYVVTNSTAARIEPKIRQLGIAAVTLMKNSGSKDGNTQMWQLFLLDRENRTRVTILSAFATMAKDDPERINGMNKFLAEQNSIYRTGTAPDMQVLRACVDTLGKIGHSSSFAPIFDSYILRYTDEFSRFTGQVLLNYEGNLKDLLLPVIETYPPKHKLEAFALSTNADAEKLRDSEKQEIAHIALKKTLDLKAFDASETKIMKELRYKAVDMLTARKYTAASPEIIAHFDIALKDFNEGKETPENILDSVEYLGRMGNHESAVKLTEYLKAINILTNANKNYEERITLAVIRNLGTLGDFTAYDELVIAYYANYPDTIKKAAREAQSRLK